MKIINGDCLDAMKTYPDNHFSGIVCDPPYGLSFMGRDWDHGVPGEAYWAEALRICKPGGHLLAFGGTRTFHRLACGIEDAGWEMRDCISWLYGSGFPKSLNISKSIDKRGGNPGLVNHIAFEIKKARESRGLSIKECDDKFCGGTTNWSWFEGRPAGVRIPSDLLMKSICGEWSELNNYFEKVKELNREIVGKGKAGLTTGSIANFAGEKEFDITTSTSDLAKQFDGFGTALKPAWEPIIVAMKPCEGTFAQNAEKWGQAGINIDGCRIGTGGTKRSHQAEYPKNDDGTEDRSQHWARTGHSIQPNGLGRWPANLLLDEEAAALLDQQSGNRKSSVYDNSKGDTNGFHDCLGRDHKKRSDVGGFNDSGGASRFFYCAKASSAERNGGDANNLHPCVKPIRLMEYLVKLIAPPSGALILDPFAGSGTTLLACQNLGVDCVGIEKSAEYCEIARGRLFGNATLFTPKIEQLDSTSLLPKLNESLIG